MFLYTHNLDEAERLCDRVAVLEHGKLLVVGAPRELAERYAHRQELEVGRVASTRLFCAPSARMGYVTWD